MNVLVWGVEWRLALANKRDLTLQVVGALSLAWIVTSGGVPAPAFETSCVALFIGFGMLRTAIPLFRDGRSGIAPRVLRGGVSPASFLLQRAAAGAGISLVSLLPAFVMVLGFLRPSLPQALIAALVLVASLWVACVIGAGIGTVSRSTGEAIVLCGLALIVLLHMSGALQPPLDVGSSAPLERLSPFRALYDALVATASDSAVEGGPALGAWVVGTPFAVGVGASRLITGWRRVG